MPDTFDAIFALIACEPLATIEKKIESLKINQRGAIRDAEHYESEAENRRSRVDTYTLELNQCEAEKELIDTSVFTAHVAREKAALTKIGKIESIEVHDEGIVVNTKPLFTNIRVGDGERKKKRRCIGSFAIALRVSANGEYKAKNLTFMLNRPHWSLSTGGVLCLGDWEDVFLQLEKGGRIAEFINTAIAYLESTDDAAAYLKSHEWLRERGASINPVKGRIDWEVGDTVVLQANDVYDKGYRGVIKEFHPDHGLNYCRLENVKDLKGGVCRTYSSWVDVSNILKISKLEYKRPIMMHSLEYVKSKSKEVGGKTVEEIINAIDSAPDGITNAELIKLIK